jgi:2-polyprenyl-3-methyl-5-hydroxy-6-metoxy-1,4-benzoquinol methylase
MKKCPVCSSLLKIIFTNYSFQCPNCNYECSNLKITINSKETLNILEEDIREKSLREIRQENFLTLIKSLKKYTSNNKYLLEVGSAHGWFLDIAKKYFKILGLEPDKSILKKNYTKLPIKYGFFPYALNKKDKFDIIVFNDVFEHIPDISLTLNSCHEHLNKHGVLLLNLPSSKGAFYRASKLFAFLGIRNFFNRMWQKDLPSPHLHYFNNSNLSALLKKHDFNVLEVGYLPSMKMKNLFNRIRYAGKFNNISCLLIYFSILFFLPFLTILPKDGMYVISGKV